MLECYYPRFSNSKISSEDARVAREPKLSLVTTISSEACNTATKKVPHFFLYSAFLRPFLMGLDPPSVGVAVVVVVAGAACSSGDAKVGTAKVGVAKFGIAADGSGML